MQHARGELFARDRRKLRTQENENADPNSAIKSSYDQRDFVLKAGWATMPKADAPNQDLASACAEVLAKTTGS